MVAVNVSTIKMTGIYRTTVTVLNFISILPVSLGCIVRCANIVISQEVISGVVHTVEIEHLVNLLMDISGRNKI